MLYKISYYSSCFLSIDCVSSYKLPQSLEFEYDDGTMWFSFYFSLLKELLSIYDYRRKAAEIPWSTDPQHRKLKDAVNTSQRCEGLLAFENCP